MKRLSAAILLLTALVSGASAFNNPATAEAVLKEARAQAKREKKNVLVIFHASWCGWCKRLDGFLESKEIKPLISKNFVVTHLTVLEPPDKKNLENAGGEKVLQALGGTNQGLPFYAVTDASGKMLVNSIGYQPNGKPSNVGHPAAPHEIAHFMKMLKATAPKLTEAERSKIEAELKKLAQRS